MQMNVYQFYVMENVTIKALSDNFEKDFDPDDLTNYLFFRLLLKNRALIPKATKTAFQTVVKSGSSGF